MATPGFGLMARQAKTHKTRSGSPITPQIADNLAAEAERGYDLAGAKRRRIGPVEPTASRNFGTSTSLNSAPWDGEELTEEDLRAVKEARGEPGISWSDAEAELNTG